MDASTVDHRGAFFVLCFLTGLPVPSVRHDISECATFFLAGVGKHRKNRRYAKSRLLMPVMNASVKEVDFNPHGDERGQLIALEEMSSSIPFEVKRIYYIYDTTPGTIRGRHAHKKLRQILICLSGACTVECEMPDGSKSACRLDWPSKGLLIEGFVWREMKEFSKDAVLLVVASEHYDESDYIRDYEEFKKTAGRLGK